MPRGSIRPAGADGVGAPVAVPPASAVIAAMFSNEIVAVDVMLAIRSSVSARLEIGLTSLGRTFSDTRSILAVRGANEHSEAITGLIAAAGGQLISRPER
jgi:hypothetical protein